MGVSNSREDEVRTNHAIKIPLKVANKISKSICRISYRINDDDKNGTGFFMLLNDAKCLFTNYHIIKKDLIHSIQGNIKNNNIIKINSISNNKENNTNNNNINIKINSPNTHKNTKNNNINNNADKIYIDIINYYKIEKEVLHFLLIENLYLSIN